MSALAFELPAALEAREPPEARGLARDRVRLMVAKRDDGGIVHARFDELPRFLRDWASLDRAQRALFLAALQLFVGGVAQQDFDPRLRVKRVQGRRGVWEMTWAADGRATFEYGPEVIAGEPHVIWRRIGTHDVFRRP